MNKSLRAKVKDCGKIRRFLLSKGVVNIPSKEEMKQCLLSHFAVIVLGKHKNVEGFFIKSPNINFIFPESELTRYSITEKAYAQIADYYDTLITKDEKGIVDDPKTLLFMVQYKLTFPKEKIQPELKYVVYCKLKAAHTIESDKNLLYLVEHDDHFEVIGHWCLASEKTSKGFNQKAFFEVLRYFKKLGKPVRISNLNYKYNKVTKRVGKNLREFK